MNLIIIKVGTLHGLLGIIPVYNCCLGIIINSVSFTLKVSLDNKLYGHLVIILCVCVCSLFLPATDPMKNIQHLNNETYNKLLIILSLMCTVRCSLCVCMCVVCISSLIA